MIEETFLQRMLLKILKKVGIIKNLRLTIPKCARGRFFLAYAQTLVRYAHGEMKFTKNEVRNECYC